MYTIRWYTYSTHATYPVRIDQNMEIFIEFNRENQAILPPAELHSSTTYIETYICIQSFIRFYVFFFTFYYFFQEFLGCYYQVFSTHIIHIHVRFVLYMLPRRDRDRYIIYIERQIYRYWYTYYTHIYAIDFILLATEYVGSKLDILYFDIL